MLSNNNNNNVKIQRMCIEILLCEYEISVLCGIKIAAGVFYEHGPADQRFELTQHNHHLKWLI